MRIIKQAMTLPEINIVCKHCSSELAYDNRDVYTDYEEWYYESYLICPVCGKRIILEHVTAGC